jgi:hypothetical protein
MKFRDLRRQVHRLEDLLGDGLGLDERDEAKLGVAFLADDLEPECFSEKFSPRDVRRLTGRLAQAKDCQSEMKLFRSTLLKIFNNRMFSQLWISLHFFRCRMAQFFAVCSAVLKAMPVG